MNIYVHIHNRIPEDISVRILVDLPAIPRIGEFVELSYDNLRKLEALAIKHDCTEYSEYKEFLDSDDNEITFQFATKVVRVMYDEDGMVHITLANDD